MRADATVPACWVSELTRPSGSSTDRLGRCARTDSWIRLATTAELRELSKAALLVVSARSQESDLGVGCLGRTAAPPPCRCRDVCAGRRQLAPLSACWPSWAYHRFMAPSMPATRSATVRILLTTIPDSSRFLDERILQWSPGHAELAKIPK